MIVVIVKMGGIFSSGINIDWNIPEWINIPEDKRVCHEQVEQLKKDVNKLKFENLVLSGGGAMGEAYCGVVQVSIFAEVRKTIFSFLHPMKYVTQFSMFASE